MKSLFLVALLFAGCKSHQLITTYPAIQKGKSPAMLSGNFMDDYGIRYSINDTVWLQHSAIRYHILKWDTTAQYLICKNDNRNPSDKGLYTRIDYMPFTNMEPYRWGFCLSVYNAKTDSLAEAATAADRLNPRKGCNGFPFSRMERVE